MVVQLLLDVNFDGLESMIFVEMQVDLNCSIEEVLVQPALWEKPTVDVVKSIIECLPGRMPFQECLHVAE